MKYFHQLKIEDFSLKKEDMIFKNCFNVQILENDFSKFSGDKIVIKI